MISLYHIDQCCDFAGFGICLGHELVGIPVFPAIEQRIGVIWRKGKYQNAVTEKVIKYLKNY